MTGGTFGRVLALVVGTVFVVPTAAGAAAPGEFDTSFGTNGLVASQFSQGTLPRSTGQAVAVQPDGKIVEAGRTYDANNKEAGFVARFNADGTPDQSFGQGGRIVMEISLSTPTYAQTNIWAVALQSDGKILVGGSRAGDTNQTRAFVARLNGSDGSFDMSFGSGGIASKVLGDDSGAGVEAIAIAPDGKIVAGGYDIRSSAPRFMVMRLNPTDGGFDNSFDADGVQDVQLGVGGTPQSFVHALAVEPDGRIVVTGEATDMNGYSAVMAARLTADSGAFDPSFGTSGVFVQQYGAGGAFTYSRMKGVAVQPDGRLVLVGSARDGGNAALLMLRLNGADGGLDTSFGTNGVKEFRPGGTNPYSEFYAVILQPNGRIVAGGYATDPATTDEAFMTARFMPADGSLDSSFGTGGIVTKQLGTAPNPYSDVYALALDGNGGLLTTGFLDVNGDNLAPLTRQIADLPPAAALSATPNPAHPGDVIVFDSAGSGDADGTLASIGWDFGDGATASGPSASHAFAAPGDYTVKLRVTDDYGLAATATKVVSVTAAPIPFVTPAAVPAVTGLTLAPRTFAAAGRGGSVARRRIGTTVRYRDSAAALTTFSVYSKIRGVRSGKRCVKRTAKRRHGKACTLYLLRGKFGHTDAKGANSFRFTGRIKHRKLRPGRYRLTAQPVLAKRAGRKVSTAFTIVR